MLMDRLDSSTATSFEVENGANLVDGSYFQTLTDFVRKCCNALETIGSNHNCFQKSFSPKI